MLFGIAHCHFSLRPEADQEADLVRLLAEKFSVPFYFRQFDTLNFAKKEKISVQMAARKLRYDFFQEIKTQENYDCIATAHHLNDSLETAIFNLAKGTGIAGLRGILPKSHTLVRPMLFATRKEIEDFAAKNNIQYLEDSSNASDKYQRNFIRHQILPLLSEQINPNIVENFSETAQKLVFTEKVLRNYFQDLKSRIWQEQENVFYLLLKESREVAVLHHFLEPLGFSFRQCLQIQETQQVGTDFFSGEYWAVMDRERLVITPISFKENILEQYLIEWGQDSLSSHFFSLKISYLDADSVAFTSSSEVLYLDAEKLQFPLMIRSWQQGDKFQPLGMKGKRKVSDFLVDEKVPKNLKNRIFVLLSGTEIAAILGKRSSEQFRVDAQSKSVIKIEYKT
ncbi:MAG: tRNA lysidine(34) synthetase TilS [Raineya sp.]